jgi:hypothetical protein
MITCRECAFLNRYLAFCEVTKEKRKAELKKQLER